MASAVWLSRLALSFGALASAALLAAAAVVASRVQLSLPASERLLEACMQLMPAVTAPGVVVLAVLALVGAVVVRGVRAAVGVLAAQRRLRRELRVVDVRDAAGVRFGVIAGQAPRAFCGGLLRPRVYVSQAALDALSARELRAVLAHEDHHRRRRDPLRLAVGAVLADAFFFVPALRRLHARYEAIAELAADEAAVRSTDTSALAAAMLRFTAPQPSGAVGVAPERVDHLLGRHARWELPVAVCAGSLLILGVLVAAAAAVAAQEVAVNVAVALIGSCMLVMALAAIAAAAGIVVAYQRRA